MVGHHSLVVEEWRAAGLCRRPGTRGSRLGPERGVGGTAGLCSACSCSERRHFWISEGFVGSTSRASPPTRPTTQRSCRGLQAPAWELGQAVSRPQPAPIWLLYTNTVKTGLRKVTAQTGRVRTQRGDKAICRHFTFCKVKIFSMWTLKAFLDGFGEMVSIQLIQPNGQKHRYTPT